MENPQQEDEVNKNTASQSVQSSNKTTGGIIASAKAPERTPTTTEVNPETDTVESRLNNLTAKGSTYTNLAKKDAMRNANTRGLINSSMAGAAGTEAAIREARPIAEADAKTYNETRLNNQNITNQFESNRQSADLNMETAAQQSALNIGEANNQSALSNEENTLLNELSMKRDSNLSSLTQEEAEQLNALEMRRDAASSELSINEANIQTANEIKRDENSARLNDISDALRSALTNEENSFSADLDLRNQQILDNDKLSDEVKLRYVTAIESIITNANNQVNEISLSDRSPEAQAGAIQTLQDNRDAQISVYQDLLDGMEGWNWSSDFTQDNVTPTNAIPNGAIADDSTIGYHWPIGSAEYNRQYGIRDDNYD